MCAMKAAEKNAKRRAHYNHLEQSVDADAARRFHEPTYSQRIPHYVKQVYEQLELVAGLSGFEIAGLRDRRTGREYYKADNEVHERKQEEEP